MTNQEILEEYRETIEKDIIQLFKNFNIESEIEKQYFAKGYREGFVVGFKEGEQIGAEKEKKSMARMMFQEGMDIEKISKITGLTEDEIKTL